MREKFREHPTPSFWRMRGQCCVFMEVVNILADDGQSAELTVSWYRQLSRDYRLMATENIRIRMSDYPMWVTYQPNGNKVGYENRPE